MIPLNFKIYNSGRKIDIVKIALRQLQSEHANFEIVEETDIQLTVNDAAVILINKLDEKIVEQAIKGVNSNDNPFIIVTESREILLAATLARYGLKNIFIIPNELPKLREHFQKLINSHVYRNRLNENKTVDEMDFSRIIGSSPVLDICLEPAKHAALNPDVSVLILGETGTGKDLLARTIHENSERSAQPFIDIICTAIPSNLLEAELFGYEKGAFTDASSRKKGLFEIAEGGTIFLDEIGDLSLDLQAKLLKVLDTKSIRRLGGTKDIEINARIMSATNKNLEKLVEQDKFRLDLFHRLNVLSITVPPLRERQDDVLAITNYFLNEFSRRFRKNVAYIEPKAKEYIVNYDWPGNIRELKNAIERGVLLADGDTLRLKNLFHIVKKDPVTGEKGKDIHLKVDYEKTDLLSLNKKYVLEVLKRLNGNKKLTAEILGISRPKLDSLLK